MLLPNIVSFYRVLDSIKEGHAFYATMDFEAREVKQTLKEFIEIFYDKKDLGGFQYINSFNKLKSTVLQNKEKLELAVMTNPDAKQFLNLMLHISQDVEMKVAMIFLKSFKLELASWQKENLLSLFETKIVAENADGKKRKATSSLGENGSQISGVPGSNSIDNHLFGTDLPGDRKTLPIWSTQTNLQMSEALLRPESRALLRFYGTESFNKLNNGELLDFTIRIDYDPRANPQVEKLLSDLQNPEEQDKAIIRTIEAYLTYLVDENPNLVVRTTKNHPSLTDLIREFWNAFPALQALSAQLDVNAYCRGCENAFAVNKSVREPFYNKGFIVAPESVESNNNQDSNNNNNHDQHKSNEAASYSHVIQPAKPKTLKEARVEMFEQLQAEVNSKNIVTKAEAKSYVTTYLKTSDVIKPGMHKLIFDEALKVIDKMVQEGKLTNSVTPAVVPQVGLKK